MKVLTQAVNEEGQPTADPVEHTPLQSGSVVEIQPFTTHTFKLRAGTIMLSIASTFFDPAAPDLNLYKLA